MCDTIRKLLSSLLKKTQRGGVTLAIPLLNSRHGAFLFSNIIKRDSIPSSIVDLGSSKEKIGLSHHKKLQQSAFRLIQR
jgi:hypothetical protein